MRFFGGTRAAYSTDASNFRQVPIGVVLPRSIDDGVAAVAVSHAAHCAARRATLAVAGVASLGAGAVGVVRRRRRVVAAG